MSELQLRSRRVPRHYATWANKLKNGLRRHRRAKSLAEARAGLIGTTLHLAGPEKLLNDEVTDAIGTFWIALLRQPEPVVFGYGSATLFERAGNPLLPGVKAAGAVPRSDTFIMPLLFTSNARDQYIKMKHLPKAPKGIGHFLLAVASRSPGEPMNIRTTLMNSMLPVMDGLDGLVRDAYMYVPESSPNPFVFITRCYKQCLDRSGRTSDNAIFTRDWKMLTSTPSTGT